MVLESANLGEPWVACLDLYLSNKAPALAFALCEDH
jgi:hypothetical protein